MACETHDKIEKELLAAIHMHDRALNPSVDRARVISSKALIKERNDTERGVLKAEYKYNSHIASCEACKSDGRTERHISEAKE